jgi:hypothetical protein
VSSLLEKGRRDVLRSFKLLIEFIKADLGAMIKKNTPLAPLERGQSVFF